jgi:hypothetical protein
MKEYFPPRVLGVASGMVLWAVTLLSGLAASSSTNDPISRIREEGMEHSQVMETLSMLTEVIGPRLTGSPNLKRANEWTRDQMKNWGLTNAHLEAWGPFGRGWSLKSFSARVIEPQPITLIGYPNAWSPGFGKPLTAEVVYFEGGTNDMEKLKGNLEGKIVLNGATREVRSRYEPMAQRLGETNLLRLANSAAGRSGDFPTGGEAGRLGGGFGARAGGTNRFERGLRRAGDDSESGSNSVRSASGPGRGGFRGRGSGPGRAIAFLAKEKAALVISPSFQGDGGTFFVSSASVPGAGGFGGGGGGSNSPRAWSTNAPAMPAQVTVAAEDYNRLVRMIQHGEKLKMAVDLQVQFHDDDLMAYNTIAEIPGSDLKKEIVMLGAHMDSWHSGTGATDNGAGVAATMEAVRILTALKLQPRRTVRIGLWSGEEQGLLGSKAYVSKHFGYYTNRSGSNSTSARAPKDEEETSPSSRASEGSPNSSPSRKLIRGPEYDRLSAYFNLDNGAGKIRGVYMQSNEGVRPLFRRWLEPFSDLGAETLTLSNTGGTDHTSFDAINLPGFQFIQDPIDYWTRTHHSNEDVFDRVPPDDLKQAATILAAFVYNAAMADEKLPRKAETRSRDD